jgi:hypothetical protein
MKGMGVFENKFLKGKSALKRKRIKIDQRKLHNEELQSVCFTCHCSSD